MKPNTTALCKYCKHPIEWDILFGKRHPFNLDGRSHMDTCPHWDKRTFSLKTLGDIDTFYRHRWRKRFLRTDTPLILPPDTVTLEVDWKTRLTLAEVLCWTGGPMNFLNWPPPAIAEMLNTGIYAEENDLLAIQVSDKAIWERIPDREDDIQIANVFLVRNR